MENLYDVIIIGAGAAGCSAAIYATRYALKTLLLGGPMPGGLITEASEVENYPGFTKIKGLELASKFLEQAKELGSDYIQETVTTIKKEEKIFSVGTSSGHMFLSKALILSTGTYHRKLNIPGESEFEGRGVSYCATCDAPFFRGKTVAVVGGGNSAVEGAQDVSVHAKRVYLIYRKELKAAPLYIENLKKDGKITEVTQRNLVEIRGESFVKSILLDKEFSGSKELLVDGVFVQVGYIPANELAKILGCDLTSYGYVKVNAAMQTSVSGVFCAGDLNNASNQLHQQITSAAEGAISAQSVFRYLRGLDTLIEG